MGRMKRTRKNGGQKYGRNRTQKGGITRPWSKKPTEQDTRNELNKQVERNNEQKKQEYITQTGTKEFVTIKTKYDQLDEQTKKQVVDEFKQLFTNFFSEPKSKENISINIAENRARNQVLNSNFNTVIDQNVNNMTIDKLILGLLKANKKYYIIMLNILDTKLNINDTNVNRISDNIIQFIEPTNVNTDCITSITEPDYENNNNFANYFNDLFNKKCKQELIATANVSILPNDRYNNNESWDLQCKYDYTLNNYMISEIMEPNAKEDTELFLNNQLLTTLKQIKVSQYIEFIDYIKSTDEKTKRLFYNIIDQFRQDNLRGFNKDWTTTIINGTNNSDNVIAQSYNLFKVNNTDINMLTLEELINYIIKYTIHINGNNVYTILVIFRLISLKLSGLKIYNSIFCQSGMNSFVTVNDISTQSLTFIKPNVNKLFINKVKQISEYNNYFNFDKFINGKYNNLTLIDDNIIIQKYSYKMIMTTEKYPIGFIYNQFTLNLTTGKIQNIDNIHWLNCYNNIDDIDNIFDYKDTTIENFKNLYKKIITSLKNSSYLSNFIPSFRSNKVAPAPVPIPSLIPSQNTPAPKPWYHLWGGKRSHKRRKLHKSKKTKRQ